MADSNRRLKIVSDGTSAGTKVVLEDSGEVVFGVRSIVWNCDANHLTADAVLELADVPVELSLPYSHLKEAMKQKGEDDGKS